MSTHSWLPPTSPSVFLAPDVPVVTAAVGGMLGAPRFCKGFGDGREGSPWPRTRSGWWSCGVNRGGMGASGRTPTRTLAGAPRGAAFGAHAEPTAAMCRGGRLGTAGAWRPPSESSAGEAAGLRRAWQGAGLRGPELRPDPGERLPPSPFPGPRLQA